MAPLMNKRMLGELKELDQLFKRLVTSAGTKGQRDLWVKGPQGREI